MTEETTITILQATPEPISLSRRARHSYEIFLESVEAARQSNLDDIAKLARQRLVEYLDVSPEDVHFIGDGRVMVDNMTFEFNEEEGDLTLIDQCSQCLSEVRMYHIINLDFLGAAITTRNADGRCQACRQKDNPDSLTCITTELNEAFEAYRDARELSENAILERDVHKRKLEAERDRLLLAGEVQGTNDKMRDAWLRERLAVEYDTLAAAEDQKTRAEAALDIEQANLKRIHALIALRH